MLSIMKRLRVRSFSTAIDIKFEHISALKAADIAHLAEMDRQKTFNKIGPKQYTAPLRSKLMDVKNDLDLKIKNVNELNEKLARSTSFDEITGLEKQANELINQTTTSQEENNYRMKNR